MIHLQRLPKAPYNADTVRVHMACGADKFARQPIPIVEPSLVLHPTQNLQTFDFSDK